MAFSIASSVILAIYFVFLYCAIYWLVILFEFAPSSDKDEARRSGGFPAVTILIPVHNGEDTVARAVRSCLSLEYPKGGLRVLAIDDGSTDGTLRELRAFGRGISVLRMARNSGKAAALNAALKRVRTPLVCCLDADSFFSPGSLKSMVSQLGPGVGAVASNMKVESPRGVLEKIQRLEYFFSIYLRKLMGHIDALYVIPGPGSVYRLEALRRVGGFDENNLTEDMDIAFRIKEAGYSIATAADAEVMTVVPRDLWPLMRQRTRWYAGYFQNVEKHRNFLFNPRFSELGLFILPVNFILILSMGFILFDTLWDFLRSARDFVRDFLLVRFDLFRPTPIHLERMFFSLNTLNVFFAIFFFLGAFVIYTSFKMSKEEFLGKRENLADFILYTLFYFPLVAVFYIISLLYYAAFRRKHLKWRGRDLRRQGTS